MKVTKDHDKYDYLSVSLKSKYSEDVLYCYRALGWKEVLKEDDKDYADMKYVLFSRPHGVENRDRLQYIQVRMESVLNRISERYVKKHRRSTALAVLFGIAGAAFIAAGLCLMLLVSTLAGIVCGGICCGFGAAFLLGLIYPLVFVKRKENSLLEIKVRQYYKTLDALVGEAVSLMPPPDSAEAEAGAV